MQHTGIQNWEDDKGIDDKAENKLQLYCVCAKKQVLKIK
jgi:hypothetical protein